MRTRESSGTGEILGWRCVCGSIPSLLSTASKLPEGMVKLLTWIVAPAEMSKNPELVSPGNH